MTRDDADLDRIVGQDFVYDVIGRDVLNSRPLLTAGRRAVIYGHIRVVGRWSPLVIVQRERPAVF